MIWERLNALRRRDALVEVTDGRASQQVRVLTEAQANALYKRQARRAKRALKNAGQRHERRTAKHALRAREYENQ